MNENKYNKFFRDKLLKYSSVIPEDMWQRIHQKNNRDRKIFFFSY